MIARAQKGEATIESRRLEIRLQLQRAIERRDRVGAFAVEQQRESAQILDLGGRGAGRLRTLQLFECRVVIALQDVADAAIARGLRRRGEEGNCNEEQRGETDQAAPRTCSSI
jgi:hypothetical protein